MPRREYRRFKLPIEASDAECALSRFYIGTVNATAISPIAELDDVTKAHIHKVAKWLTSDTGKPSLLLYGGIGNGKTTMLKAIRKLFFGIMKANADKKPDYWKASEQEKIISDWVERNLDTPALVSTAECSMVGGVDYAGVRFLLLDDLGVEPTTVYDYGTETTPIINLLYRRYDKRQFTVVTSNLDDELLQSKYGARVADRLVESFDKLSYTNASYRK